MRVRARVLSAIPPLHPIRHLSRCCPLVGGCSLAVGPSPTHCRPSAGSAQPPRALPWACLRVSRRPSVPPAPSKPAAAHTVVVPGLSQRNVHRSAAGWLARQRAEGRKGSKKQAAPNREEKEERGRRKSTEPKGPPDGHAPPSLLHGETRSGVVVGYSTVLCSRCAHNARGHRAIRVLLLRWKV